MANETTYISDVEIVNGASTTSYLIEPTLFRMATTEDDGNTYTTASLAGFALITGATIQIKFGITNQDNATLSVNSTTAKAIWYNNAAITASTLKANHIYTLVYDGSYWQIVGDIDSQGTVTKISTGAGLTGGDITTSGTIKAMLKSETKASTSVSAMGNTSSRYYAVGLDKDGYLAVNIPWVDTKVTSAANHYAPSRDNNADKSASANGATATWGIDVVTGVTAQTDGKGHITAMTVASGKVPANPILGLALKNTDWNTLTTEAIYYCPGTHGCTNTPTNFSSGSLRITCIAAVYYKQEAFSTGGVWSYRIYITTSQTWTDWKDYTMPLSGTLALTSDISSAINALDGNLNNTTPGAGKTLTAFSQTDGKISATFGNISITKSQISDFSHTHGNINTSGQIGQTSNWALASGDGLVVFDSSNSNKLERTGITFDVSTETKCLTKKGTWADFNNYSHPTGDGNLHVPVTGTDNDGKFLKAGDTAGSIGWANLTHSDITDFPYIQGVFYGTCSTAQSTKAKKVILVNGAGFTLNTGAVVIVKFTNASAAATMTLEISNDDGTTYCTAKNLYQYGTTAMSSDTTINGWAAGAAVAFVYDGTRWERLYWYNTTYWRDSCYIETAASTAEKVGVSSFYQANVGYLQITIRYTNTADNPTLNINSQGAKPIYMNGTKCTTGDSKSLPAGTYLVYYNGTNYYFRTDNKLTANITGNAGSATQVYVTNTAVPSSGNKTYYLAFTASTTSGNQDIRNAVNLYLYEESTKSDLCIGTSSLKGGLTIHGGNGKYGYIATTILDDHRSYTLPNASGTIALVSDITASAVGLSNVENTALSTWTGTSNISTVGTITSGTWNGTTIAIADGGTGATSFTQDCVIVSDGASTPKLISKGLKVLGKTNENIIIQPYTSAKTLTVFSDTTLYLQSGASSSIIFTRGSATNSRTESGRFNSSGKFVIGYPSDPNSMTSTLTLYESTTTANNTPAKISFQVNDSTKSQVQNTAYIAAYHTHAANNNGMNMVIQSAGNVFIGGGETANSLYNSIITTSPEGEALYLTADGNIYLEGSTSNNSIATRKGMVVSGGNILPVTNGTTTTDQQNLGSSSSKWATVYATTFDGNVTGTSSNITGTLALANFAKGDANKALVGQGSSASEYISISPSISITAGTGSNAPKINVTVLGVSGTTAQELTKASTSVYGATMLSEAADDATLAATAKSVYDLDTKVDGLLAAANAMVFKGTIGDGGDINTTAETPQDLPAIHEAGWTYYVITPGTYKEMYCEEGTLIVCIQDRETAIENDVMDWTSIETNEDGSVIGPSSSTDTHIAVFNGNTGRIIKDSGFTIATSVPSSAVFTDVNVTATAKTDTTFYLIGASGSSTATGTMFKSKDIWYTSNNTSGDRKSELVLGNSTKIGSSGGRYGQIRLYGNVATYYLTLAPITGLTANRSLTLPNKDGTLMVGTTSTTTNAIAIYSDETGTLDNSAATIDSSGNITATSFIGDVTGDVIGDVTGDLSGTAAQATADADGNTISSTYYKLDGSNTGTKLCISTQSSAYTNQIQFMNSTTKKGSIGFDNTGIGGIYAASKVVLRPQLDASTKGIEITTSAMYPTASITLGTSTAANKWSTVYATTFDGAVLKLHQGTAANPSLTGNARIEFDYTNGQPVVISYTPNDGYRNPAGLKVMGGASATPAWFEVEGQAYAAGFNGPLNGNATTATTATYLGNIGRQTDMDIDLGNSTYNSKVFISYADGNTTNNKPSANSMVFNVAWDNVSNNHYGAQIAIHNSEKPHLQIRGCKNGTWDTSWFTVLDSDNTAAGTNNNSTLTWSTTYTIAKINGTDIKFTTMAQPTYAFSDLTTHPTTLSGYGITDAMSGSTIVNKVKQTSDSTNKSYKVLFTTTDSPTSGSDYETYYGSLTYNPNKKALSSGGTVDGLTLAPQTTGFKISGGSTTSKTLTVEADYTLAAACAKAVDTSISAASTSANLPTSAAVAAFVEGKGYLTSHYSAVLYTASSATGKAQVTAATSNPYLNLVENSTVRSTTRLSGSGATSVTSSADGKTITISSTDTNTLVNYTLGATTKAYLMASQNTPTSTTTARAAYGDTLVYLTSIAGELSAKAYSVNDGAATPAEKVYMEWNSTDQSLDFIFN